MRIALLFEVRPSSIPVGLPADTYSEFEDLETIQAIFLGLESLGHTVLLINSQKEPWEELHRLRPNIDLVFNCSVGIGSRFRELMPAAICEALGLTYTGSDPMAQAIAANKHLSKLVACHEGVPTPEWRLVDNLHEDIQFNRSSVILKPAYEGSSIGTKGPVSTLDKKTLKFEMQRIISDYRQPLLMEEFIKGFEVTVPVLGNPPRALPPVGLALDGDLYLGDKIFDATRKAGAPLDVWRGEIPVSGAILKKLQDWACIMHSALGCRDLSRSDFRISDTGDPYFVEINATPQIAPSGSSFSESAMLEGLDFRSLLGRLVEVAINR